MSEIKRILLVEDSANDIELTLGALEENHLANEVVVVRDGAEALDFLYKRGVFKLRKNGNPAVVLLDLKLPRVETPTHHITMAFNEDLDDAAKDALREMIKLIGERMGLEPSDAYMFSSLAVDMRVTQLVDGNKGIHAMLPKRYAERVRATA